VKTADVQCGKFQPICSEGWKLPASDIASINRIKALRILNLLLRATDFCLLRLPLHKWFSSWGSGHLEGSWTIFGGVV